MAGKNDDVSNISKPAKGTGSTEKKKRKRPSKKVPTTVLQANSSGFMHLVQKLTGSAEELAASNGIESSNPTSPIYRSPYSSPSSTRTTGTTTTNVDVDTPSAHYNSSYNLGYSYSRTAAYSSAPAYTLQQDVGMPSFQDHCNSQQYHELGGPVAASNYVGYGGGYGGGGYVGAGSGAGSGSGRSTYNGEEDDHSYGNYSGSTPRGADPASDRYNSSPSSSRGMEQNVSPFSWREPVNHNSSSDYYWY